VKTLIEIMMMSSSLRSNSPSDFISRYCFLRSQITTAAYLSLQKALVLGSLILIMNLTRRQMFCTSGFGIATFLSGCLDGLNDESGSTNFEYDEAELTDVAYDLQPLWQITYPGNFWWSDNDSDDASYPDGHVEHLQSATDVEDLPEIEDLRAENSDHLRSVEEFIETVDFDEEIVLYVASWGTTHGYDEMSVEKLASDGNAIVGETTATQSEADDSAMESGTSSLLRIESNPDAIEAMRMTILRGSSRSTDFYFEP